MAYLRRSPFAAVIKIAGDDGSKLIGDSRFDHFQVNNDKTKPVL